MQQIYKNNRIYYHSMQIFHVYHPDTNEFIRTADNLHIYSHEYISSVIQKQITLASWNSSLQYDVIGSDGDKIIYQEGKIQISKSSV